MLSARLAEHLPPDPRIVIALSGGPDSVFLAHHLLELLPKSALAIAHFDHRLRDASVSDAEFCRDFAAHHGVRYFEAVWQTPEQSEAKARAARMAFLQETADRFDADAIALGTHGDDEAETIFFNFLRGSGLAGLGGIKTFDPQTRLFRPLLQLCKQDILDFLADNAIEYRLDHTNFETTFDRNFLRNEIFPPLKARFGDFDERLRRQAAIFRMAATFVEQAAEAFLAKQIQAIPTEIRIARADFAALAPIVQMEVVRKLLSPSVLDADATVSWCDFLLTARSGKRKRVGTSEAEVFSEYFFLRQR